jgi:hypothetical protein
MMYYDEIPEKEESFFSFKIVVVDDAGAKGEAEIGAIVLLTGTRE